MRLEQKIEIFERFREKNPTEEIKGKTVFEGYPIGEWAIKIRNSLKENSKSRKDIDEKQLRRLKKIGILESQRETISESIQALIDWVSKYPRARFDNGDSIKNILKEYAAQNEKEFQQLYNEYCRLKLKYNYLCERIREGKLSKDQIEQCKEGNIRGVFGYTSETQRLAELYRISCEKIDYIVSKYGSIEKYIETYRDNGDFESDVILKDNVRPNILIDLNSNTRNNARYLELYQATLENGGNQNELPIKGKVICFDGQNIVDAIEQLDMISHRSTRTTIFSRIIKLHFGLEGEEKHTLREIADIFGITHQNVQQKEKRALQILRTILKVKEVYGTPENQKLDFSPEERNEIDVLLGIIYNGYIFRPDKEYADKPEQIELSKLEQIIWKLKTIEEDYWKRKGIKVPIEFLEGLSDSVYNILRESGIDDIQELMIRINANTLRDIDGIRKKEIELIQRKLEKFNSERKIAQKDENGLWVKNIADLDVTVDIENYARLSNSSIDTEEKVRAFRFINLSSDVIKNMCVMEEAQFKEFINAIQDIEGDVSKRVIILRNAGITYVSQLNAIMDLGVDGLKSIREQSFSAEQIIEMMNALNKGTEETLPMLVKYYRLSCDGLDIEQSLIDILNLSTRTLNALKKANIFTIQDLISKNPKDLKIREKVT